MKLNDFVCLLDDIKLNDSSNGNEIYQLEESIESLIKDIFVPVRQDFKKKIIKIIGKKEESDNQIKLNAFSDFYLKIVNGIIDNYELNYNEIGLILALGNQQFLLNFVVQLINKHPDDSYCSQKAAYALKKEKQGNKLPLVDKLNYKAQCKHYINQLKDFKGEYEYQLSLLNGGEKQTLIEKTNSIEDLLATILCKFGFDIQLMDKPSAYWNEYPVTSYSILKGHKNQS